MSGANSYKVDSEALGLAHEIVSDPETRAKIKAALEEEGKPGMSALVDEAVLVAREVIRLAELPPHGPGMPQWVSVADRMPENDTFVLVCNGKWTGVGLYIADEAIESERWQDEHREFIEHLGPKVTHWMPLPGIPATGDRS